MCSAPRTFRTVVCVCVSQEVISSWAADLTHLLIIRLKMVLSSATHQGWKLSFSHSFPSYLSLQCNEG